MPQHHAGDDGGIEHTCYRNAFGGQQNANRLLNRDLQRFPVVRASLADESAVDIEQDQCLGRIQILHYITVTLKLAGATLGGAPAVMLAEPVAPDVTRTVRVVVFAGKVTVCGTVATPGVSEAKVIVRSVGAGSDRMSVTYRKAPGLMVRLPGKKLSVSLTCTCWLTDR